MEWVLDNFSVIQHPAPGRVTGAPVQQLRQRVGLIAQPPRLTPRIPVHITAVRRRGVHGRPP